MKWYGMETFVFMSGRTPRPSAVVPQILSHQYQLFPENKMMAHRWI